MRIAVIGGGAGGTYVAALLKRARPDWAVTVYERNHGTDTFGFGVVFSEPTLDKLRAEDEQTCAALLARSARWDPIEIRLRDTTIQCGGQGFAALERRTLLELLQAQARAAGVELRFGETIEPERLPEADVVIVADGARSAVRRHFEARFESTIAVGRTRYIWLATSHRFDCLTFLFEENRDGAWAVHAYPFDETKSTFIVETDEGSWRNAGLDIEGEDITQRSIEYCRNVFTKYIGNADLLSNRSVWARFRTVRNQKWHHENLVLLGDAAHTAHFSMGSGTKMALEDALALARALTTHGAPAEAFAAYEKERRMDVHRIQRAAEPSLAWWENFASFMPFDPAVFTFHFLTRNLKVSRQSIEKRDPAIVHGAADVLFPGVADLTRAPLVLESGIRLGGRSANLAPFDGEAALAVAWSDEEVRAARERGAPVVALVVPAKEASHAGERASAVSADIVLVSAARDRFAAALKSARESSRTQIPVGAVLDPQELVDGPSAEPLREARGLAAITLLATQGRSSTSDARAAVLGPIVRRVLGAPVIVPCGAELLETMLLAERADVGLLRPVTS
jgi:anthraniloyl-CoA monooxygenase